MSDKEKPREHLEKGISPLQRPERSPLGGNDPKQELPTGEPPKRPK